MSVQYHLSSSQPPPAGGRRRLLAPLSPPFIPCLRVGTKEIYPYPAQPSQVRVFQLRYGGSVHASTLCGLTDFLSFAFKAPFMFLFGEKHKWSFE